MRERAIASSLLIAVLLCISVTIPTWAQQKTEWTWKDRDGKVRSRAELEEILLKKHELFLKFGYHWEDLRGADLKGADLALADLRGADLRRTDLREANLDTADLRSTDLREANLRGAFLQEADLRLANLNLAHLEGANLSTSHLSSAYLWFANLSGARFEPDSLPILDAIASAQGLELMRYNRSPVPLTLLRKQFQDAGYREQERAITCVLNRHDADPFKLRAALEEKWASVCGRPFNKDKILPFKSFVEGAFKWIAFDLPCEYGLSYGRPLRIVGLLWLFFSLIYAAFMHLPGTSGIYFIGTRVWRGKSNTQGIQVRPEPIPAAKLWKIPFLWLGREWRVLRAAMFFSLMSAFNIGFRDIDFGRWLRLLTKREYDLRAAGWARTVSGFQSLLSVYLIALWVLSYFGRPFG